VGIRKKKKLITIPTVIEGTTQEPDPDEVYINAKEKAALAYQTDMKEQESIVTRDAQLEVNRQLLELADTNFKSYNDIVKTNLDTLKDDILQKYEAIQTKITTELEELVSTTVNRLKNIDPDHGDSLIFNFNKNHPLKRLEHMDDKKTALIKDIDSIKRYLEIWLRQPLYESIKVASEGEQNYYSILGTGVYYNGGSSRSSKKRRKPIKKRRNTKRRN
jgi:hypothetical protein